MDSAPPSSAMDVVVSDRANPISKGGEEHSVYSTAAAVWDESELLVLEEGRRVSATHGQVTSICSLFRWLVDPLRATCPCYSSLSRRSNTAI